MVILTILAWATQTLLAQWGFGQTTQPTSVSSDIVEIRCEATIYGTDVTLKELCRWNDNAELDRHKDVVIWQLSAGNPVRQVGIEDIRTALSDGGVNLSRVQFAGAASCAVRRSEVDDATFAQLLAKDAPVVDEIVEEEVKTAQAPQQPDPLVPVVQAEPTPAPAAEPATVQPELKVAVAATRPAFRQQLVLARPLSADQKIMPGDVVTQLLKDDGDATAPPIDPSAIIGGLLIKGMRAGDVITVAHVKPEPLVTKDQFVTVTIPHQGTTIETVARAMESGAKGQVIQAKNEATGEIYNVTITASAAGELQTSKDVASTE